MHLAVIATLWLAVISHASAAPQKLFGRSEAPTFENGTYVVNKRAQFAKAVSWTFNGSSLPAGLHASNHRVGRTRRFLPSNVFVRDGYLQLLVNGGQTKMPYKCGEVVTDEQNILYASVRTVAILTEPAGVCNGMFFYQSDTQETDIEWLSDRKSESNAGTRQLWLTNQATNGDEDQRTSMPVTPPSNPTTTEHEYRLDWTAGRVQWFVDGKLVKETTNNVPSVPGPWMWNNWADGDSGWSAGPPAVDAVLKIRKIDMYYNTA